MSVDIVLSSQVIQFLNLCVDMYRAVSGLVSLGDGM